MVVLTCLLATVKGVRLHDVGGAAVIRAGGRSTYDTNCVEVRLKRGGHLGHWTTDCRMQQRSTRFQTKNPNRIHGFKGQRDVARFP